MWMQEGQGQGSGLDARPDDARAVLVATANP